MPSGRMTVPEYLQDVEEALLNTAICWRADVPVHFITTAGKHTRFLLMVTRDDSQPHPLWTIVDNNFHKGASATRRSFAEAWSAVTQQLACFWRVWTTRSSQVLEA